MVPGVDSFAIQALGAAWINRNGPMRPRPTTWDLRPPYPTILALVCQTQTKKEAPPWDASARCVVFNLPQICRRKYAAV